MTPIRWDPFRGVNALQERINRLFDESFAAAHESESVTVCAWKPVVDIYQCNDEIVIKAELPGVQKADVSVEITDNVVTLKGARRAESEEGITFYRQERCTGSFYRSFTLPDTINPDKVTARFKDGILTITVPRQEREALKKVAVDIQ